MVSLNGHGLPGHIRYAISIPWFSPACVRTDSIALRSSLRSVSHCSLRCQRIFAKKHNAPVTELTAMSKAFSSVMAYFASAAISASASAFLASAAASFFSVSVFSAASRIAVSLETSPASKAADASASNAARRSFSVCSS